MQVLPAIAINCPAIALPKIFHQEKAPAGTVLPSYKLRSLRTIFRNHLRPIPTRSSDPRAIIYKTKRNGPKCHQLIAVQFVSTKGSTPPSPQQVNVPSGD